MTILQFTVPPLPHYIMCGEDTYSINHSHPNRKNIEVFDILVVTKGSLYIGEDNVEWGVKAGETLILRPDRYHYSSQECNEETHFYWLHFQTKGNWLEVNEINPDFKQTHITPFHKTQLFTIDLPKFCTLSNPAVLFENLQKLLLLGENASGKSRLQEQAIFQEILMHLHRDHLPKINSSVINLAQNAADFLRQNYHQQITYNHLSEALNFHSAYITRCMKQVFGCTPQDYLTRYRLEQSKIYLLNTDKSISEIAEKVGFSTISYFTKTFAKSLKITPLNFRNQFR